MCEMFDQIKATVHSLQALTDVRTEGSKEVGKTDETEKPVRVKFCYGIFRDEEGYPFKAPLMISESPKEAPSVMFFDAEEEELKITSVDLVRVDMGVPQVVLSKAQES